MFNNNNEEFHLYSTYHLWVRGLKCNVLKEIYLIGLKLGSYNTNNNNNN